MPNEQLAWIDPFIYQEWPVRLAHQMTQMNADTKATRASAIHDFFRRIRVRLFVLGRYNNG